MTTQANADNLLLPVGADSEGFLSSHAFAAGMDTLDEIYVGGVWAQGAGALIESVNPATSEVFATLHGATVEDVDVAVAAGPAAIEESGWARKLPHERAAVLYRIGATIEANADRIATLQTRDTGKTLKETRALAMSAAATFRFTASALETMEDTLTPPRGDYLSISTYEPIGVVAAITPWNSPIASDAQRLLRHLPPGTPS